MYSPNGYQHLQPQKSFWLFLFLFFFQLPLTSSSSIRQDNHRSHTCTVFNSPHPYWIMPLISYRNFLLHLPIIRVLLSQSWQNYIQVFHLLVSVINDEGLFYLDYCTGSSERNPSTYLENQREGFFRDPERRWSLGSVGSYPRTEEREMKMEECIPTLSSWLFMRKTQRERVMKHIGRPFRLWLTKTTWWSFIFCFEWNKSFVHCLGALSSSIRYYRFTSRLCTFFHAAYSSA